MNAKQRRAAIIELAREKHQKEGTLEIDDNAKVSYGNDNGAYVQAWVWVDFDGTPFDKEKPSEAVVADLTVIVGEAIALTAAGLDVPAKVWTALHKANMKVRDMIE